MLEYEQLPSTSHESDVFIPSSNRSHVFSCFGLFICLGIHTFSDGLGLGLQTTPSGFWQLLIGSLSHQGLCSAAYGASLANHNISPKISALVIGCLSANLIGGLVLGLVASANQSSMSFVFDLDIFVLEGLFAGVFLCITCVNMIGGELGVGSVGCPALIKSVALISGVLAVFTAKICLFWV